MRKVDREMERQLKMLAKAMGRERKGFKYRSLYDAQLAEGLRFSHKPYTEIEREILLDILGGGGRPPWREKQCFYNAQVLAAQDERLEYAEGVVLIHDMPFPIEHGWAVLGDKPVDVTLRERGEPDTCTPEELLDRASRNLGNSYVGVFMDLTEVRLHWFKTGRSEAMLLVPELLETVLRHGFIDFPGTR